MNGGTATVFGAVVGVNGCREYEFGNVGGGTENVKLLYVPPPTSIFLSNLLRQGEM